MTARSLYIASPESQTGKSVVALGLIDLFSRRAGRVAVFRPIVRAGERDGLTELLLRHASAGLGYDESVGVTYDDVHADPEAAMSRIVAAYHAIDERCDVVVIVGSDYTDVAGPAELAFNARVAANLGAQVLLVMHGVGRTPEELRAVAEVSVPEIEAEHARVVGVVVNRATPSEGTDALVGRDELRGRLEGVLDAPVWVVPDLPLLTAPSVRQVMAAVDGRLTWGLDELLDREAESVLVGGMSVEHILDRLRDGQLAVAASDRTEILLALLLAQASKEAPSLAGIVLNGGFEIPAPVRTLVEGLDVRVPVIEAPHNTFETAQRASLVRGPLALGAERKVGAALGLIEQAVDAEEVMALLDVPASDVVTPLMFEHTLTERARAADAHVVLPEGSDDRILRAASTVLARGVARLTILGDVDAIRGRAAELGLDLSAATLRDPSSDPDVEAFAAEYARLRAHKGMTVEAARPVVRSVTYFGVMMVHAGQADGMVSGAVHTTADTIRPAFEVIRTAPGTSIVSSVFLMCLPDKVLVYGDCAVNPNPDAAQLADIAASSARTAQMFGIEPRVAMLSYSTGASGAGADVEKVASATEQLRVAHPELAVEGPIQYDAAIEPSVASTKLPDSDVAGKATVFVFPDLNTGNNTYKAVQRSAGAVAIGPLLQGLNKPVNDLSRGALVEDIVNTIAMTAVQSVTTQGDAS